MIFQNFQIAPPCPPGGGADLDQYGTRTTRSPMVHMTKFDQIRLKDLGARRVDDRQTDTQTNAGNNNGNPSDRANRQAGRRQWPDPKMKEMFCWQETIYWYRKLNDILTLFNEGEN